MTGQPCEGWRRRNARESAGTRRSKNGRVLVKGELIPKVRSAARAYITYVVQIVTKNSSSAVRTGAKPLLESCVGVRAKINCGSGNDLWLSEVPEVDMSEQKIINPINSTFLPRLTEEFIELYNATGARRIANHQVLIQKVPPKSYTRVYMSPAFIWRNTQFHMKWTQFPQWHVRPIIRFPF